MIKIGNLRKESKNGWTYLKCDFEVTGMVNPFKEDTMWVAVEDKNEDMLSTKVYDPFVLLPVYLGMHYGQDVCIEGNVSARLYHNVTHYLMSIFDNFSDYTQRINLTVKGFDTVEECDARLVGTANSCGVDSLVTIYDNYVMEQNPDYKINSLFFVNCGLIGRYSDATRQLWIEKAALSEKAADELGLPMYLIDSNFAEFVYKIGMQKIVYLAIYSCVLSLQKYVRRYLMSGNFSYDEVAEFGKNSRDFDIAEYSETYLLHLISTEKIKFVIDGAQYTRGEKIERISDWDIARKYLNVCYTRTTHGFNCSDCNKCMWTLIPLEAMGKLEDFSQVFNLDIYKKNAPRWKRAFVSHEGKDAMETSIVRYTRKKNLKLPSLDEANKIFLMNDEIVTYQREMNHQRYKNRNIVLFGAGKFLNEHMDVISEGCEIKAIVDNSPEKWGELFGGLECKSPDYLGTIERPVVIISIINRKKMKDIKKQIYDMGIEDVIHLSEWMDI